jgi:hypothetical protein
MQEDQEDFDDKNYPEDYDDHGSLDSKYKHYFKFDPEAWDAWGKWLYDALNEVVEISPNVWYAYGFPSKSIPVSSYLSNAGKGNTFQYLGNNYQKIPIWKKKYFVSDPLGIAYIKHLQSHANHFLNQPHYYKGLYEILN